MTRALSSSQRIRSFCSILVLLTLCFLVLSFLPARSATVLEEDRPLDGGKTPAGGSGPRERVVVTPEPPHWSGWGGPRPGVNRSAPRVRVWIDRGEWSTYRSGDRLWVYFRVDRPCYVTILDYAPDGSVDTIYPSRWSGSSFVSPGITYVIPESRRYSLRIAGSGGIETLVACAHETPWPSGPSGVWIPRHRPGRGRVEVGRPGGSPPPGRHGRPGIFHDGWPVPPAWRERPEIWSCDSVSFYVDSGQDWRGAPWGWDGHDDWRGDAWGGPQLFHDSFHMATARDRFYREMNIGGRDAVVAIECVESESGQPTEIAGRLIVGDGIDEPLFRLDVDGKHGNPPVTGQVFHAESGGLAADVRVAHYEMKDTRTWQVPRLESIDFEIEVRAR